MKPSKKGLVKGILVRLLKDEEAYYSGYAGNPVVIVKAGTVGIIGATDVPYVTGSKELGRGDYFACVDFLVPDKFSGNPIHKNNTWRCGVNPKHLKIVPDKD